MHQRLLERLPIFACAGFIGFLFLAHIWNFAVERDWPKLRIRSSQPLDGVARPEPAPWTLEAFLAGKTQRAVSVNLGRTSPVFPISVRAKNQLLYSLFGVSGAANVEIGRDGQLFATGYIEEYCRRGAEPDMAQINGWADEVAEISERARKLGKGFLYLVSPSKAAHAPQYMPSGRRCPALADARAQEKLEPYDEALAQRATPYLDAARLLRAARADYPIDLFPRGGIHWNLLGAALTLREATRIYAAQPQGSPIGEFDFSWREDDEAKGADRDLLDLLNLFWPDDHYPTAAIRRASAPIACARVPRLALVGDSFLRELIIVASQAPCPPTIDYWFYMRDDGGEIILSRFRTAPGEIGNGERLSADLSLLPQSIAEADAILLEENESSLALSKQVGNLLEATRDKRFEAPP
jgi:alginate O-acetyltransferase complex protein AlgJ